MCHVAAMGVVKTSYQIFGNIIWVKGLLGGPQPSWNGIKMNIKWHTKIWDGFVWLRVICICVCLCRQQ
jgi:hypothetical protein